MIKDFKLGIKSLDYAHGLKKTCVCYVLLLVLGTLALIFGDKIETGLLGGYFLICSSLFPVQLLYSLSASNMLQASPAKKRLQTSIPAIINSCCVMLTYFLFALGRGFMTMWGRGPEMEYGLYNELLAAAMFGMLIMVYSAFAYKYFVVSVILFFLTFGSSYSILGFFGPEGLPGSLPLALGIGAALIAAGGFLEYLFSLLVYKAPMSRLAQPVGLRREL